jgi:hypothetical protein
MANRNPSPATRFQKGNKLNLGKPKGRTLAGYLRDGLEEVKDGKTRAQRIAEKLLDLCEEGDRQAIKDVFERLEGKVPDKVLTESEAKPAPRLQPKFHDDRYPDDPDENPPGGQVD